MGEPPVLVDPRRWGGLVGLAGGVVFVASYSPALGAAVSAVAAVLAVGGVGAALFWHYVRPSALGPLSRPRPVALLTYGLCVVGELAAIAVGSRVLASAGLGELRPALIAAVVGVHFLPFAWAFGERMFLGLGAAVAVLGAGGLALGASGVEHAADASAVLAGLTMITLIARYSRGRRPRRG